MTRPSRVGIIHLGLAIFVVALLVKTAKVQLFEGKKLSQMGERQQSTERTIPAPRGNILDSRGETLAQSRETVKLDIAPKEVRDLRKLRTALERAKIPHEWVARATDGSRKWVSLPGRYLAIDVAALIAMRGVYSTPIIERAYSFSEGTRRLVGRVDADGKAVDGVELALDSLLKGTPGTATVMKDARGRRFESPEAPPTPPVQGNSVVLTINQELQEIAERALADAVAKMGAEGGDVVVMDPADGEVLAMASHRSDPRSTASTALTEPYEPGSTLKPFIAAQLLQGNKASESDMIPTYGGTLTINGRTITDDHANPPREYSLADVLRFSSNVGIVQFALRLSPREEYETLRDFGFGTPTGVTYPVEAAGTLRPPTGWSKQSANSLAMGYEIGVTPLQLAAAYVALANDGELLEPTLVKEVRSPDGTVLYRHQRRVIRRVISPAVARRVRGMLLGVVEGGGTAKRADLGSFALAGKTGTPRSIVNGRYAGGHIPTFVGLFPADNPQFVILVKIDNPKGAYLGGLTAAPVTKAVLQAALASRNAALDRRSLAASRRPDATDSVPAELNLAVATRATAETTTTAQREALRLAKAAAEEDSAGTTPFVASIPAPPPPKALLAARAVPDVRGLPLRQAVHALHAAGFRVSLIVGGSGETSPSAGVLAPAGSLIRLAGAR